MSDCIEIDSELEDNEPSTPYWYEKEDNMCGYMNEVVNSIPKVYQNINFCE